MFNKKLTQIVHVHPDFHQEGQKNYFLQKYHYFLIRVSLSRETQLVKFRTENGGGNRIRTGESRFCRPLPYHLAMPPSGAGNGI